MPTILTRIRNRLRKLRKLVFFVSGYEILELVCPFPYLLASIAVLNPYTSLYTNGRSYMYLAEILPEKLFGAILLFIFLCSFFSFIHGSLRFRQYMTALQSIVWIILFGFLLAANPDGLIYYWVAWFAIMAIIPCARIKRDIDNHIPTWTILP